MSKRGSKSRSFSIYLLKEGVKPADALESGHPLKAGWTGDKLPEGSTLYVLDAEERPPWWQGYFGVKGKLDQVSKGALVFIPVGDRLFALSFGHVHHELNDTAYEHDFGLRVTLNAVDPDQIKSTDILHPSGAKRQRIQLPTAGDLTLFDIDQDSTILKSLTGKVKDAKHRELFRNVTGAANLRLSTAETPGDLSALCAMLLKLYEEDTYKTSFPSLLSISPVRDPKTIDTLNAKLIEAVRNDDDALVLTIPEIQDFNSNFRVSYAGAKAGSVYDDAELKDYRQYLTDAGVDPKTLTLDDLKRHRLLVTNDDGSHTISSYKILRCLLFDAAEGGETYHLREGEWYRVEQTFVAKLKAYLDPRCAPTTLPDYAHASEGVYNKAAATNDRLCLDTESIAPPGQKAVEPCDLFEVVGGRAVFHHIKLKTLSGTLSHLFNQGVNSVWLIRSDNAAMTRLKALLSNKAPVGAAVAFHQPLIDDKLKISYGVVTKKKSAGKSDNLPLFSRISLMRAFKDLQVMGIEAELCFIADSSTSVAPTKKVRKPRAKKPSAP